MKVKKLTFEELQRMVDSCEDCIRVHADFWKTKTTLEQLEICRNKCLHPHVKPRTRGY